MNCCRRRFRWLAVCLAGWLLLPSVLPADELTSALGKSLVNVSPADVSVYRPERWGRIDLSLFNPTDEPIELFASTFFEDEPSLQYGRRVWLPAKSRLRTSHPIRLPKSSSGKTFNTRTLVMPVGQQREVLFRGDSGQLQLDGALRATDEPQVTGLIQPVQALPDRFNFFPDDSAEAPSELVVASRLSHLLSRRLTFLSGDALPATEESLEALDQLVILDSRVMTDIVGMASVRRWMFNGGRLWIMLDQVDPQILERLLGDEFRCEIVDRVGLTTVRIGSPETGDQVLFAQDYERPVEFVRAAVTGMDVAYTVEGWPAAFWKNCGDGKLLVTTLGARGWMRRRTAADETPPPMMSMSAPNVANRFETSSFILSEPMSNLAGNFFGPKLAPLLPDDVMEPISREYVGYSVSSRFAILGLLIGFSVLLLTIGVWLSRRRLLEWLGAIGPGMALAVSLILVFLGHRHRSAIPATVSQLQVVRAIPGTDDLRVSGVVGAFNSERGQATITARQGGWLLPDSTGFESVTRRMVWLDQDVWQWENLPEMAGLRSAKFRTSGSSPERLEARATFGSDGMTGQLQLPGGRQVTDAVLATRSGRFAVVSDRDGRISIATDQAFSDKQFLASGLLSDEQDRRRRILEQLLTNPERREFPEQPVVLAWSAPWDAGFRFSENRRSLGSSLVVVPVTLQRPAVGTEFRITSPFLPFRPTRDLEDLPPTSWFETARQQWIEKSSPSEVWLRFQIPDVLLPLAIQRGRVTVQVNGPVGKLSLAGYRAQSNSSIPLKTWIDPVGTVSTEITDPDVLSLSADGGFRLFIAAGVAATPDLQKPAGEKPETPPKAYWQIESLRLELDAKTIDSVSATKDTN